MLVVLWFAKIALTGEQDGPECVKLETQALITDTGPVRLDSFPWELT